MKILDLLNQKNMSLSFAKNQFLQKQDSIKRMGIPRHEHAMFFPKTIVRNMQTTAVYDRQTCS